MKKVLSTIVILATATAAFAQGYVFFNPGAFPIVQTNSATSALFGGPGSGGTAANTPAVANTYYYALLIQPQATFGVAGTDTAVWDGSWTFSGLETTNLSTLAGRINAVGGNAFNVTGLGWNANTAGAGGNTNNIVLVGWSANLGTSWAAVSTFLAGVAATPGANSTAGFFGESMIGYLVPNGGAPGAGIFAATPTITVNGDLIANPASNPIELYALPVPEPATMALAGLGGLALVLIRRRK